ncbi:MAG TPA: DsrE family protein [Kofleriaceae bacterium]|nr:DsrE family protein [Kofleriaceae bacterium]
MSVHLAFVLATAPETGDLAYVVELAMAARRRKLPVSLFAMHHGVRALAANPVAVATLLDADCDLVACATSADAYGIDLAALGVVAGSQDDHAAFTDPRYRVIAFT